MKKPIYIIIAVVIVIIAGAAFLRFVVGGSEDSWICLEGEWVKHGAPSAPKPTTGCEEAKQEVINKEAKQVEPVAGVAMAQTQDLAPEGFTWDGTNFWTAHEPGWEMDDPADQKPGGQNFQIYLFKHANDQNKTAMEMYTVPHHYNVIGLTVVNGDLYSSSSDPGTGSRRGGRIIQHNLDANLSVKEIYFYNLWE